MSCGFFALLTYVKFREDNLSIKKVFIQELNFNSDISKTEGLVRV